MKLHARLIALLPAKAAVLLGLAVGICVPYFGLQSLGRGLVHAVPVSALDRAIPFQPGWALVYSSIALLVPLFPLLASTRAELSRYAQGLALLCVASFVVFLLYPVSGPRPETRPESGLYLFLVGLDAPTNSMPSLHAGLTVYSFLFGMRILRDAMGPRCRRAYLFAAWTWTAAILYSTLAIKQHWLVDLPPGALLAWLSDRIAWRSSRGSRRVPKRP